MLHSPHTAHERWSSWYQWTLAALVAGTLVFGAWGHWRYERIRDPEAVPDALSVAYHTLQLLVVHGAHLEGTIPLPLQLGRLLGVAVVFTAIVIAFVKSFRHEVLLVRLLLPWRRDHVVVCGLGDLGLRLALDARRRGKFVVAIDKHALASIARARTGGVLVLEGDASDADLLGRARVARAEYVIAACQEDRTNVAVAALVRELLAESPHRERALLCRLLVRDHDLRRLLSEQSLLAAPAHAAVGRPKFRVNFEDLHLHDTAARQAFREHPLDFQHVGPDSETLVHLVVAGLGAMGQSLVLQAARIGHFANSATKGRLLRITLVDRDADYHVAQLRKRYGQIDKVCELVAYQAQCESAGFIERLADLSRDADKTKQLVTYAVCFERGQAVDDRQNLQIGVELARLAKGCPVQTLIYQSTRRGFAALLAGESASAAVNPRLHAFGMHEDIYNWEMLLHESEDLLAKALHDDYHDQREREGVPDSQNPGWDELREDFKESNRHAADHIPIKLRALSCHDAPLEPGRPRITRFTDEQIELAAQMEHLRWCAERWLAGWEYGPETIRERKISSALVEWAHLPEDMKRRDREQIMALVHVLESVGRGIYR